MNRWALLRHDTESYKSANFHFDFLLENGESCATWKIFELPKINGSEVKIIQQANHRLVWLTRHKYKLSKNRGFVKRIDYGIYKIIENNCDQDNFSLFLNGKILYGIFKKEFAVCKLYSDI